MTSHTNRTFRSQFHSIQTASAPEPFWERHRHLPTASQRSLKRQAARRAKQGPPSSSSTTTFSVLPSANNHHLMDINMRGILCLQPACTCFLPESLLPASANLVPTTASGILWYVINMISSPCPALNATMCLPPHLPFLLQIPRHRPRPRHLLPHHQPRIQHRRPCPRRCLQQPTPTHAEPPHSLNNMTIPQCRPLALR
jgi:hypothetical protein